MGSKGPKYNEDKAFASQERAAQAQAKYGTYGVQSNLGGLSTVQNPDGTYSLSYQMNDSDKMRQSLVNQGLASLDLDPNRAQEAYYNQATRQLLPQFERDQQSLRNSLINRGITEGSALYNEQMDQLIRQQSGQLADISNQSVFQGQNYLANQIGNIGSLAGQYDLLNIPGMSGSTGAQFNETYSNKFANQQQRAQAKNAMYSQIGNAVGGLIGSMRW